MKTRPASNPIRRRDTAAFLLVLGGTAGCTWVGVSDVACQLDADCPTGSWCAPIGRCAPGLATGGGPSQNDGGSADAGPMGGAPCASSADCAPPLLCGLGRCELCGISNPCPLGELCTTTGCALAASCTGSDSTSCSALFPGSVCLAGSCSNCSGPANCEDTPYGSSFICDTSGLCVPPCTQMGCQSSGGRLSYCDPTTETCAFYQCLVDSDCDAGQVCDLATNSCIAGCSPACAAGTACDVPHNMCLPTTCRVDSDCPPQSSCVNLHVGGGLSCGYICASANDCNPGYSCCQAATSMDQASSTAMVCSPTTPCHGD